jgi:hypothetical protein
VKLKTWMKRNRWNCRTMAKKMGGVSFTTIHNAMGEGISSAWTIRRIYLFTGREVSWESMIRKPGKVDS